jgi:phytoene desaturase
MDQQKTAIIIGSGIGGLGAACLLAAEGYRVTVYEKNAQAGGRAGSFSAEGFTFDTGPSWYLMPDIFEHFFDLLGERVGDHLTLERLSPSYRVFYKDLGEQVDIYSDLARDRQTFERLEPGAGTQLERYLHHAAAAYQAALRSFLYKNYTHLTDLFTLDLVRAGFGWSCLSRLHAYVKHRFKDPRLQKLLEYPMLFLGTSPFEAPAVYSLLAHATFEQGVFYPRGGMYELTKTLVRLAEARGVTIITRSPVERIIVDEGRAVGVVVRQEEHRADIIVSNADIAYTEQHLLPESARDHSARYWETRRLAPSALLLYLGIDRCYPSLAHHNLLFSLDWRRNFAEIFGKPAAFPDDPSIYVGAPSKTDPTVAPPGQENLFVLVPVAAGLDYTHAQLAIFTDIVLRTLETELKLPDLRRHIKYQRTFCVRDFAEQYNSCQGTGLGLAHTLRQTAVFRPKNYSQKARGLYYVGANVHPGIGLPTALVSAELLIKRLRGDTSSLPLRRL